MKYVQCSPFLTVKGNVDFNLFYEIEKMFIYLTVSAQVCVFVSGKNERERRRESLPKRDEYKLLVQNNNNSRNTNV